MKRYHPKVPSLAELAGYVRGFAVRMRGLDKRPGQPDQRPARSTSLAPEAFLLRAWQFESNCAADSHNNKLWNGKGGAIHILGGLHHH